jgi:hypothetical protein
MAAFGMTMIFALLLEHPPGPDCMAAGIAARVDRRQSRARPITEHGFVLALARRDYAKLIPTLNRGASRAEVLDLAPLAAPPEATPEPQQS